MLPSVIHDVQISLPAHVQKSPCVCGRGEGGGGGEREWVHTCMFAWTLCKPFIGPVAMV